MANAVPMFRSSEHIVPPPSFSCKSNINWHLKAFNVTDWLKAILLPFFFFFKKKNFDVFTCHGEKLKKVTIDGFIDIAIYMYMAV